jgi:hypothetical protein
VPLLERRRRLSGFRGRLGPAGDRGPTQRGDDGGGDGSGTCFDSASHLVAVSPWSDEKLLAKVREQVVPEMTRRGSIEVSIIDDTGFPRKARILSGCIISTAGCSPSRPIARWR